jgi:hypothetical protein
MNSLISDTTSHRLYRYTCRKFLTIINMRTKGPAYYSFLIAALLLLFPFINFGQILNIDKSDTSDYVSKTKTTFNFSTGLEIDKQQTTLYDATNTAELMLQKKKELFILAGSYRFTYNGPDDILNAGFIHLRFRHNYKNKYQPESFIQYQWDNKRGLEYRAVGGINLRYNFWKGDKWDLNAGLGLMYEEEKWNYAGVDSNKIPSNPLPISNKLIKINSYIRIGWKASENSDIAFNVFLQTRPGMFQPRIAPGIQWNIAAGKHIGFVMSFAGIYDEAPVVPINHFYYSLSNSIVVKF